MEKVPLAQGLAMPGPEAVFSGYRVGDERPSMAGAVHHNITENLCPALVGAQKCPAYGELCFPALPHR